MPVEHLASAHDPRLVALSVVIAVLAAGAALDLAGRVTASRGLGRFAWLGGGAIALGLGIWSMHYTAMLAFSLPVTVSYHVPTVLASLLAAVVASAAALFVVSRERMGMRWLLGGALCMGSAIAAMHYTGMAAMRVAAVAHWNSPVIMLSVAIAMAVSFVGLWLAYQLRELNSAAWPWQKLGASLLIGAAIPIMHYTGMAAVRYDPMTGASTVAAGVPVSLLGGTAIVVATVMVLGLAILSSVVDRPFAAQAAELAAAHGEIKRLQGLLPICAGCKQIKDEDQRWRPVEEYVRERSDAEFSHALCPSCAVLLYGADVAGAV